MKTINLIIVLAICCMAQAQSCHSNSNTSSANTSNQKTQDNNAITESFKVYGNCDMCKKRIEDAVDVKGVYSADWNPQSKKLTVSYNAGIITHIKINLLIVSVGHDTEEMRASDNLYNALHMCCQYERNPAIQQNQ